MGIRVGYGGAETRPDLALLDPHFSTSLPARLTAWTGMDALIHAFEAATNRYAHKGAQLYAYEAIRLSVASLPDAVAQPDKLSARTDMLLASYYAGCAINLCSTSIAHALSRCARLVLSMQARQIYIALPSGCLNRNSLPVCI